MERIRLTPAKWFVVFVVAFGLVLAACGQQTETDSGGDSAGSKAPADEQVLRLRLQSEPKTIDPHLSNQQQEISIIRPLFAGLFSYDEDLDVVPDLAMEMPTVANGGISEDGTTYTIKIKPDAMWSDGEPVTAHDFVYSMKRAMNPELAGTYASFFYSIVGAAEYNSALGTPDEPLTPNDAELASLRKGIGVEAKGQHTIVYKLTQPAPNFLNLLALWTAFPVRQDIVEKYGDTWTEAETHVGNGAFTLSEWKHGDKIVMEPNPYWNGDEPDLRRIELFFIEDDIAAYQAYQAGEIDVVNVPPPEVGAVSTPGHAYNDQLTVMPELATGALFLNNSAAPFDDVMVRKAFGTAIDRDAYVNGVLQGSGVATTGWIPPGMPGYNPHVGKQYEFDAAKARTLLSKAGYPDGEGFPKVTFIMVNRDTNRLVGQFVQQQLEQNLGVEVEFEYLEGPDFGRRFTTSDYQATITGFSGDWPYPDNWLPDLFSTGARNNLVGFSNERFDELVAEAAVETDNARRLKLYNKAHTLMIEQAGLLPLYNPVSYVLVKPRVRNYVMTGVDGYVKGDLNLDKVYIADGSTAATVN